MTAYVTSQAGSSAARQLLAWYDRRRRDLPWRRDRDPYRVWISEIMLQQTRVSVVVPYYQAFLRSFPDVRALAAADLDQVLAHWSGLGYYRRARQLHAAARALVADHGGTFPTTAAELRRLPGIGPYTSAAIASICFDEPVPVLDGNVERVLARRLTETGDVKRGAVRRRLLEAAAELLDPIRPGDSNQAMMELGATICTPRAPDCTLCPLAATCLGRDHPEDFPAPREKRATVHETHLVAVVFDDRDRILLFRRHDDHRLMAGLWELPTVAAEADSEAAEALGRIYGGRWTVGPERTRVKHSITHRALDLRIHLATVTDRGEVADAAGTGEVAWFDPAELATGREVAVSSMVPKTLAAIGSPSSLGR